MNEILWHFACAFFWIFDWIRRCSQKASWKMFQKSIDVLFKYWWYLFCVISFWFESFWICCISEWVITTFMIVFKKTIVDACYVCVKLLIFDNGQLWTFNFILFWILSWLFDVCVKIILNFISIVWLEVFQHDSIDFERSFKFFCYWNLSMIFKYTIDAQINLNTNANRSFSYEQNFYFRIKVKHCSKHFVFWSFWIKKTNSTMIFIFLIDYRDE